MRSRTTDPITSKTAGDSAALFAGSHVARILHALEEGPGTAADIGHRCGLTVVQVDRRLVEMQRAGQARVSQVDGKDLIRNGFRVWQL